MGLGSPPNPKIFVLSLKETDDNSEELIWANRLILLLLLSFEAKRKKQPSAFHSFIVIFKRHAKKDKYKQICKVRK